MSLDRAAAAKLLSETKNVILAEWMDLVGADTKILTASDLILFQDYIRNFIERLEETLETVRKTEISISQLEAAGFSHGLHRSHSGATDLAGMLKEYQILQNLVLKHLEISEMLDRESRDIILDAFQTAIQMAAQSFHHMNKDRELQYRIEKHRVYEKEILAQERSKLGRLFDQAPVPIFMTQGPDHICVMANPAFIHSVGHGKVVIGKTLEEVWPSPLQQNFCRRMDRVFKTGQTQQAHEIPMELHQVNGVVKQGYFNFIFHPLKDVSNHCSGILMLAMDVSSQVLARQSLRESEERFRVLADSMPQMVWTSRPNGEIDYCSRGWSEFTGAPEMDLLGWGWLQYIHPDDCEFAVKGWKRAAEDTQTMTMEQRFRSKNGGYHWFLVRGAPLLNDRHEVLKWYGTCTDINEQKQLAEDLKVAKAQAEDANRAKSAFLANMSHEIRTPLSAILGYTELLSTYDVSVQDHKEFLGIINRNGQALTHLINDILDLSKVEAGRVEIEKVPFSLSELIHEIFDLMRETVRAKGLQLSAEINPELPNCLLSDPTRIRQVLINVIGNAVKFTEKGSVKIAVNSVLLAGNSYEIQIGIQDTGPGLTDAQKAKLFVPFTQADSSATRKFGGSGLGLALSKRMAKILGGDVKITKHKLNEGCTFVFSFKAESVAADVLPRQNSNSEQVEGPLDLKVLVVDDLQDNRTLVRRVLTRKGATVDVAADGAEGIQKALHGNYDVVLMDLQMPEMDGYEAVRKLRSSGYKKPVLALTAHAMDEERQKTFEAGYDGHLTKPLNTRELMATLTKYSKIH